MTSQPEPKEVADDFVKQYYEILHQSPDIAHKFYGEPSILSRPDLSGAMTLVTTLDGINNHILSMDYQTIKVKVFHVDAQTSSHGGVIVLVIGDLMGKENLPKKFTQTFFLAPQKQGGYYVLNDIFRYVDGKDDKVESLGGVSHTTVKVNAPTPPTESPISVSATDIADHHAPNLKNLTKEDADCYKELSQPVDNGKFSASEKRVNTYSSVMSVQADAPPVKQTAVPISSEEVSKKSFAAIVHDLNKSNAPFNVITRCPAKPMQHSSATTAPEAPASSDKKFMQRNPGPPVKGHSIFIGNLLDSVTVEQLKEVFEPFGSIKPDAIQLRSQKDSRNCFAFVEFESSSAVEKVFKAGPIMVGNRRVSIEEKRGHNGGGRGPPGQGGYRDNFRGRGNSGEARGYRRNEYEKKHGGDVNHGDQRGRALMKN